MTDYKLRLYITGFRSHSRVAIDNLTEVCESLLPGRYELEIIDVLEHPDLAEAAKILATPTLVRYAPEPVRKVIGDLGDRSKLLAALGLQPNHTSLPVGREDGRE